MGSGKPEKHSKTTNKRELSLREPRKIVNIKKEKATDKKTDQSKNKENQKESEASKNKENQNKSEASSSASASQQRSFFIREFQSANGVRLSSLELESIKETCFVELSQELGQDVMALGNHIKAAFGPSWKQVLCEGQLVGGRIDPGSPAVVIITTSASRSIELLRGVRSLTKECHAVKLFSKHMKLEEQVAMLKNRANFASGTPSRVKKLIDVEALGLSRLTMIVLDMHTDVKGYSLLTLPQVRDEFWDLYKGYFHQRLLQGYLRICLFGPIPEANGKELKGKRKRVRDEQATEPQL